MCPWCHRGRFQHPRPSTDSGDSRDAVCRHRGQHLRELAETSVEVRRSCSDTALNDEIVEVPGWCDLTIQTSSIHRSRRFIRQFRKRRQIPEIMQRQVLMIQKEQAFGPKMNEAGAQLNRVGSSADTGSSERRADPVHRKVVKPRAERSTSRRESADVVSGSRGNGARRA